MKILKAYIPVFLSIIFIYNNVSGQYASSNESHSTDLNLQVGSGFSTGYTKASHFTQSIAPSITWNTSDRFSLQAGTVFSFTSFTGNHQNIPSPKFTTDNKLIKDNSLYNNMSYAFGHYKINNSLTFTGGTYFKSSNISQFSQPSINDQAFSLDSKGIIMGFDYRINDNIRIGGEVNFHSGNSPYFYQYNSNPFSHSQGLFNEIPNR